MISNKEYRKVFIIESRTWWKNVKQHYNVSEDIVLTYDFGLHLEIKKLNGEVFYVDHLLDKMIMQENNFIFYKFFKDWHYDAQGNDIFNYRNIPFGFSLRLEIWNDLTFYMRTRICMDLLHQIRYDEIILGADISILSEILNEMNIPFSSVVKSDSNAPTFYFPIQQWMDEKVRYKGFGGLKYVLRDVAGLIQGSLTTIVDRVFINREKRPAVFVQEYHPTKNIIKVLLRNSRIRVILATFSKKIGWLRYIPVFGKKNKSLNVANEMLEQFKRKKYAKLILHNNTDISDSAYKLIEERISNRLQEYVYNLDSIINFIDRDPIKLIVLVTNIGKIATLVNCVGQARKIPSYLIINGCMSGDFLDESKYATYINGYSKSIKDHYFRNIKNVFALGDPRMDGYAMCVPRTINRVRPTISIGTSAYSVIDLNSFLAVEFDFLFEVLSAIQFIKNKGIDIKVIIKVRANGYIGQYRAFVEEYFPGITNNIVDNIPIKNVFESTDLYISLYSQTHFEASCMGIPCIYHKNDSEILDPPYDGDTELVRTSNIDDLVKAIDDFLSGSNRYDAFLKKSVMEKYIGPLDGKNLERNIDFIYKILDGVSKNGVTNEVH